ncbi:kinase-like protein [Lophium mytilinum]|uniref:Kinase-like protein n=1 Tax=Lophium mytilinum TaxID=390894 RepID=A0A6A6RE06_9PEZI|nr:kinase-like protein [Lophium mytilinum]
MQHSSNSPWRLPPNSAPQKHAFSLQHTVSMVNLHEEPGWQFPRSPPSPSASTTSSTTSRSSTPTNSNNPYTNMANTSTLSLSNRTSPNGSPQSRTPQYTSRSATPVAPQPVRPIVMSTSFNTPTSPAAPSAGESLRGNDFPLSPAPNYPHSPTPNPYRSNGAIAPPPLPTAFVTPTLLTQYGRMYPDLLRRQGWERSTAQRTYTWALSNPRTALLFFLCDDVDSWRKAVIYCLEDEKMPFSEDDLQGIAANPKKAIEIQWRVTAKELPQNGGHVEFQARETVPLQPLNMLRSTPEKNVDKVAWLGDSDDRILVRKRFIYTRPSQKSSILTQIADFKRLDHRNISRVVCSYAQGNVIGIVTNSAQYSLDDYLQFPLDAHRAKQLLDWTNDLCQAVDYLHAQQISHRGLRPRKILIDGSRVYLAAFGISSTSSHHDEGSPHARDPLSTSPPSHSKRSDPSYFTDQSYLYAAPESITPRAKKPGRPADVFALGCIFLAIMTVLKSQSLTSFSAYRAGGTHDASFHANADRVANWRMRLQTMGGGGWAGAQRERREQALKLELGVLGCIEAMVREDPGKRVKMRKLAPYMARLSEVKSAGGRRRSFDGLGVNGPNGVQGLNGILNGVAGSDGYYSQRRYEDWGR